MKPAQGQPAEAGRHESMQASSEPPGRLHWSRRSRERGERGLLLVLLMVSQSIGPVHCQASHLPAILVQEDGSIGGRGLFELQTNACINGLQASLAASAGALLMILRSRLQERHVCGGDQCINQHPLHQNGTYSPHSSCSGSPCYLPQLVWWRWCVCASPGVPHTALCPCPTVTPPHNSHPAHPLQLHSLLPPPLHTQHHGGPCGPDPGLDTHRD